jgi:MATE family, multidrug efflux pump
MKTMQRQGTIATHAPHAGHSRSRARVAFRVELLRLLRLAGPIIVSQLGQVGMNTADTVMVGPLGPVPLAAAGLGSALHWLMTVVCMGTLVGTSPLVSQAWGAKNPERTRRVLVQGLWLAFFLAVPVTLASLFGRQFANLVGQDPDVSALTGGYLTALAAGIVPFFLFMAIRQYLEAMGYVRAPMVITFLGLAINIVANRVLIYGVGNVVPALGVVGSGWATTLVRWSMLLALGVYLFRHPRLRIHADERLAPDPALQRQILRVGLPVGGQFGLEMGLFSFAAIMMGWLGPLELAAHQVTINIASTTFMVALGVSMAGSIRVGQHIGARRPRRMRRATLGTYLLSVGFMGMCALLFVIAPRALIGLYTREPAIVDLGARLLLVAAAFQMFDGAQVSGVSALRGAGDTRWPAAIAALGYWGIGVPVALVLGFVFDLGPVGVWIGLTAGLFVAGTLLAVRARRVLWHTPLSKLHAG